MTIKLLKDVKDYTDSDIRFAEFIEASGEEILFMNIGQVAERTGMSEATISRSVRHLGFTDFKDLKRNLISEKTGGGAAGKMAGTLVREDFAPDSFFAWQQNYLKRTSEKLTEEELGRAVSYMKEAKRIFIYARNASASMAQLLFFRLRRMGIEVTLLPPGGSEVVEGLSHAKKQDLVILFGFSKISKEGKLILDCKREVGYKVLTFTSRNHIPEDERGDVDLYVYRGESGEYHSMVAAAAMVDILVLTLAETMKEDAAKQLKKIENLKQKYRELK
ncbi:MAG: MurR/RpiR family transcriptional regulator [Suilimivivens sp.]